MSDDLYDILGVENDADSKAIKRAYRGKAKQAHPDGGGSTEAFEKVNEAYAVLTDQRRRAKYDATGKVDEKQTEGLAFVRAMHILTKMFMDVVEKDVDLARLDLTGDMKDKVEGELAALRRAINRDDRRRARAAGAAKRFKAKAGKNNVLSPMFAKMESDLERHLANLRAEEEAFKMALDILAQHDWTRDTVVSNPFGDDAFAALQRQALNESVKRFLERGREWPNAG